MANIKSNDKKHKQDEKKRLRNKAIKSEIKTAFKKAEETKIQSDINHLVSLINSAVTSGVFHKNKAARLTSKAQKIQAE